MINPGLKCYEWPISILQEQIEMITLFIAAVSFLSHVLSPPGCEGVSSVKLINEIHEHEFMTALFSK